MKTAYILEAGQLMAITSSNSMPPRYGGKSTGDIIHDENAHKAYRRPYFVCEI